MKSIPCKSMERIYQDGGLDLHPQGLAVNIFEKMKITHTWTKKQNMDVIAINYFFLFSLSFGSIVNQQATLSVCLSFGDCIKNIFIYPTKVIKDISV